MKWLEANEINILGDVLEHTNVSSVCNVHGCMNHTCDVCTNGFQSEDTVDVHF